MGLGIIKAKREKGFTIVELLVIIVVIGILASIVILNYSGVQKRARDAARKNDVATIVKALELYYSFNRQYPVSTGSTSINGAWSTSGDASWDGLKAALKPYAENLPKDPVNTPNGNPQAAGKYAYAYFSNPTGSYCGVGKNKMYILVYRYESATAVNDLRGTCVAPAVGPYGGGASNVRIVH